MLNEKHIPKTDLTSDDINQMCKAGIDTVEGQLVFANARIKSLEETIKSLHLKHEIAHYASIFLGNLLTVGTSDDDENVKIMIKNSIAIAKVFIKKMEDEK